MNVVFPKLGVTRRFGLRQESRQAEYGTPWSWNVRLEDSLTGSDYRLRGGSTNRLRGGSFVGSDPVVRTNMITYNGEPITYNGQYLTYGSDSPTLIPIIYRDRSLTFDGNVITASRVSDSSDTDLSADVSDMLRPTIFQCSEAGEVGPDIVSLVPHKDQYLLCFSATETWVQTGDPLSGPRRRVSDQVGIVGFHAWCVAHDTVYFLSSRGLYSVGADGSGLKALSENVIPEDLLGLDSDSILLDYDHATRGVSIHLPEMPSWFYDTERGGFWPFYNGILDSGLENQSHVLLGPLRIGQEDEYGRITDIHGNMALGSSDVTWAIVPGRTAEEAAANGKLAIEASLDGTDFSAYVSASGVWSAGRSHRAYPRTRTIWCCLWLSASDEWAYEAVTITKIQSGKWR